MNQLQRILPLRLLSPAFLFAAALLCTLVPDARADDLHLRDGRIVTGNVTRDGSDYVVTYENGAAIRFPEYDVVKLVPRQTTRERYANLAAVTSPTDAKAQYELGMWCRINNLPDEAKLHFQHAIDADPNNIPARKAAGYVLDNGVWLSREAYMTKQGKALYKGEWINAADAQRKLEEDARRDRRATGATQAYQLLGSLLKNSSVDHKNEVTAQLLEMGDNAMDALLRESSDPSASIREVCLKALGSSRSSTALRELFRRLRYENEPPLVRETVRQILRHPDRERTLKEALELCVHSPYRTTRRRTWLILRGAQDPRVIPALIELAEYNPVPEEETKSDKKEESVTHGWVSSTTAKPKRNPYYPATEALNYLTGVSFQPLREQWAKWWDKQKDTFTFKPLPGIGDAAPPEAESEPGVGEKAEDGKEK